MVPHGIDFMQQVTQRFRESQPASADEYPFEEMQMKLEDALLKLSQLFTRTSRIFTPATIYHHLTTIYWASAAEDEDNKPLLDDIIKYGKAYDDQNQAPLAKSDLRRAVLRYALSTAILAPETAREDDPSSEDPVKMLQFLSNMAVPAADPRRYGDVELLEMICYLEKYDAGRMWPEVMSACKRWAGEEDCAPESVEEIFVQLRLLNLDEVRRFQSPYQPFLFSCSCECRRL